MLQARLSCKQAAVETDLAKKAELQRQIEIQQAYLAGLAQIKPTPPTRVLRDGEKITLKRGGRAEGHPHRQFPLA